MGKIKLLILVAVFSTIFALNAHADYSITSNSGLNDASDGSMENFGRVTTYVGTALSFTTIGVGTTDHISVCLQKDASPTDDAVVSIESNGIGGPSNVVLASGSISATSITSGPAYYDVSLTNVSLSASTAYWVVLTRSGSTDNTNFYRGCGTTGTPNDFITLNGSAWTNAGANGEIGFTLYLTEGGGGGGGSSSTTASIAPIFTFTALLISMLAFLTFMGVMWLIALAVGYPLAYFAGSIFKMLKGPKRYD